MRYVTLLKRGNTLIQITNGIISVPQYAYKKDYFGRVGGEKSLWSTLSESTQEMGMLKRK